MSDIPELFVSKKGETVLIVVRHTQVDWDGGMKSYSDVRLGLDKPELSEEGWDFARNMGETMARLGVKIDAVVYSPYKRTEQTAEAILDGGAYEIEEDMGEVDVRLQELQADGLNERGPSLDQLKWPGEEHDPEKGDIRGDIYEEHVYNRKGHEYAIESPSEQAWRVRDALKDVARKYEGKVVLVVTHGEPGAYGVYQTEIGEGPVPLTYTMKGDPKGLKNRMDKGDGRLMRFDRDGNLLVSADLDFEKEGTELSIGVRRFIDRREEAPFVDRSEHKG